MSGSATLSQEPILKGAISMANNEPRMVGPFPERAWVRVLIFLADAQDVFTDKHIESILTYACDRRTLEAERERMGSSDSVQKWKVLEQMGCLMY